MKLTRQQAINAMCKDCIYDPKMLGGWRQQVEQCPMKACPLYPYRPIPKKSKAEKYCKTQ